MKPSVLYRRWRHDKDHGGPLDNRAQVGARQQLSMNLSHQAELARSDQVEANRQLEWPWHNQDGFQRAGHRLTLQHLQDLCIGLKRSCRNSHMYT